MKCDSWAHFWPAPLQTLTLVTSPRLRLRQQDQQSIEKLQDISMVDAFHEEIVTEGD
jgi:hypothetical protein